MSPQRTQIAVFFIVATVIYGGLHICFLWEAVRHLDLRALKALGLGLFFFAMSGHTHDGQLFPFRWLERLLLRIVPARPTP